jgi:hypothetical protein
MGKGSKRIAASSGGSEINWHNDCEAHHVSLSSEEDRRRSKSAVGEVQSREEDGIKYVARINPAASVAGFSP